MSATHFGRIEIPKRMLRLDRDKRGYPIPYVAAWSSEIDAGTILPPVQHPVHGDIMVWGGAQGEGDPVLGEMNPARQRECMGEPRCQVCHVSLRGKRRYHAGSLRLLTGKGVKVTEGGQTLRQLPSEPPVCPPCMVFALQVCPGLLRQSDQPGEQMVHVAQVIDFEMKEHRWTANPTKAEPDPMGLVIPVGASHRLPYGSVCDMLNIEILEAVIYTKAQFLSDYQRGKL